jgi:hypothetical protein
METPQEGHLVMQPVIPILGKIICNAYDQKSPPKGNPFKCSFEVGKNKRQKFETNVGHQRSDYKFGNCIAHDIQYALIFIPVLLIKAKRELDSAQYQYKHWKSPGTQVLKDRFNNFYHQ